DPHVRGGRRARPPRRRRPAPLARSGAPLGLMRPSTVGAGSDRTATMPAMDRTFLSMDDLSSDELHALLDLADRIKAAAADYRTRLAGKAVAMIFEKPSTRTRISFEVGIASLGAHPLALSSAELQLGRGETIEDTGRVLSRYVDAVVLRTFGQERLQALASTSTIPIVNALSDLEHPCQCLADLLTIRERKGKLEGLVLAYVGDGNNVAHSLLIGGAKVRISGRVGKAAGYEPLP